MVGTGGGLVLFLFRFFAPSSGAVLIIKVFLLHCLQDCRWKAALAFFDTEEEGIMAVTGARL